MFLSFCFNKVYMIGVGDLKRIFQDGGKMKWKHDRKREMPLSYGLLKTLKLFVLPQLPTRKNCCEKKHNSVMLRKARRISIDMIFFLLSFFVVSFSLALFCFCDVRFWIKSRKENFKELFSLPLDVFLLWHENFFRIIKNWNFFIKIWN